LHDEPPLRLRIYDELFTSVDAIAYLTPEEQATADARFRGNAPGAVVGAGVPAPAPAPEAAVAAFRARHGLGDRPYIVVVGRLEPVKGAHEIVDWHRAYRTRHADAPDLVIVGDPVNPIPPTDGVHVTGFVDEAERDAAMEGALALVQPSYFESFSLALAEAWSRGKPALVNARSPVLLGQAHRSGGAIPYEGYAEYEAALEMLCESDSLRTTLGERGRAYVGEHYRPERVLAHYEQILTALALREPA
jgi:glycosyltransferase involved in cell wall biosynthesis